MPLLNLKIEENSDIIQKVSELMEQEKLSEIQFVSAKGKIRNPEIVSSGRSGSVLTHNLKGDFEVNAISGSIFKSKKTTEPQVNVAVAQTGANSKIGKLVKAKAGKDLELTLRKIDLSKMIM